MEITIVSLDTWDMNDQHLSKRAWDESRHTTDSELADVLRVEAPVNEMPSATMLIHSTIIEREIITCLAEHIMWSTSSRVDDPTAFKVAANLSNPDSFEFAKARMDEMRAERDSGEPQDQFRTLLPLTTVTKYMVRLSLRAVVVLRNQFEACAKLNEHTSTMFMRASEEFRRVQYAMGFMENYEPVDIIGSSPPINGSVTPLCMSFAGFTVWRGHIPFTLRTHMTRHRLFTIVDELKQWIIEGIWDKTLRDKIFVSVSATDDAWEMTYRKRSCWLAQTGLWAIVMNDIAYQLNFTKEQLPCADGNCPFKRDVQLRLEGKDPNAPCPRYADITSGELTEEQHSAVDKEIDQGGRPMFWHQYKSVETQDDE